MFSLQLKVKHEYEATKPKKEQGAQIKGVPIQNKQ